MTKFIKPFAEILSCILILWTAAAHAQTPATGAFLSYNAYGGAAPLPLYFNINGVNYQFPFTTGGVVGPSTSVIGHCATWNNTTGTLLADAPCGAGGSGFPITLGSTSIAGSSTTTTIAGLTLTTPTLTTPTINGAALSGALSGSPTFNGVPLFTGLSVGTQVSCLGLTAGNALALSSAACGAGGGLPSLTSGQFLGWANSGSGVATATNIVAGSGATFVCASGTCTIGATGSGGVSGPGSSVNGDLASWNGTAGNALSDSGILGSNIVQTSRTISTASPLTGGGGLSSNLNLGITIPNSSLLGGNGTNFTSIGLGSCFSIPGGTLTTSCTGTVTSVGLSLPTAVFSISGSPVTGSGNLTGSFVNQAAGSVFSGPSTGSPAAPGFRALVNSDLPTSGVGAGSYTTANITVNAQGVITSAANGSASTPVVFTGTTAGAANAQTIAAPSPTGYTLTDQNHILFKVGAGLANTAASPTLAVNGTSAEPMDMQSGGALAALPIGYLQPALQYSATYQAACTCYVVTTVPLGALVQATTSQAPTAAQWSPGETINLNAASLVVSPVVSTTLSPSGGLLINALNAGTLTATSPDTITTAAGTTSAGGSVTLGAGTVTIVTTDGAGHLYAAGNINGNGTVNNSTVAGAATYYAATGTAVSPQPKWSYTSTILQGNYGTGPGSSATSNGIIVFGADGNTDGIGAYAYQNGNTAIFPSLTVGTSAGTGASPTAIGSGLAIGGLVFDGYNGSTFVGGAQIIGHTTQAFTGSVNGTRLDFLTTANGSNTLTDNAVLDQNGALLMPPTVTGGNEGPNTINAAGLYVNGVSVGGGQAIRVVTVAGAVTITGADNGGVVVINKGTAAATTVNYTCSTGLNFHIKDGAGNDATDAITLTPSAGTLDLAATFTMNSSHAGVPPYEARHVVCDSAGNSWME